MSTWSPERDDRLRVLWGEGLSAEKIALKLGEGLTRNSIIGRAHRLHLPPHGPIPRTSERHRRKPKPRPFKPIPPEEDRKGRQAYMREHTKQQPVAPKAPPQTIAAPKSKRLKFYQLTNHVCHYIADAAPPYTYCGHLAEPGKRWCKFHYELCVQVVSPSEANRRTDRLAARYG